jgi:hypothetical protein
MFIWELEGSSWVVRNGEGGPFGPPSLQ